MTVRMSPCWMSCVEMRSSETTLPCTSSWTNSAVDGCKRVSWRSACDVL